jgi:hypothetical protein
LLGLPPTIFSLLTQQQLLKITSPLLSAIYSASPF